MNTFEDYPEGSILSEMRLDIFASDDTGELNLFYEGEFYKPLSGFEYNKKTSNLVFVFDNRLKVPLGAPIDDKNIHTLLCQADDIAVFQVTLEGQPGEAQIVALKVL